MTRSFTIRANSAFYRHSLRASFLHPRTYTTSPASVWDSRATLVW